MQILAMLRQLVTGKEVTHISESAMYFISYVDQILQDFPDAKFICIERDHEKTLKSWMGITKNNVCHWSTGGTKGYWPFFTKIIGRHWDRCFPKYNLPHEEACRKYIEDYYDQVRLLQNKYPKNILIVSMDDFTSKQESRLEIFNFIGYKGMRNFNVPHEHKNRDFLKFFSGKI